MRPLRFPSITLLVVAVTLLGCASLSRQAGFADIERITGDRAGMSVHWNQGTPEDNAADKLVRELLGHELTVDASAQVALLHNRNLQATFEELGIAQADLVQAGLLKNPIFDSNIRFGSGTGVDLAVAEDFIRALQLPLRKRVATAKFERAKLEVAKAVLDLATDTRAGFFAVQAAEELAQMRATVAKATRVSSETAERVHRAGNITDVEFANEQVLHAQVVLDLADALVQAQDARERLNRFMGVWGSETEWKVAQRLPKLPRQEVTSEGLESRAVAQRLDLAAARQEILANARGLTGTKAYALIAEANIGANGQREIDGPWTVGPSLALPLPLFDQGQAAVFRALAEVRRDRERYAALAVEIRSQVRAARNRMLAARAKAEYYRQVVLPLRRQVVQKTQLQYNAMLVGVFQLLQAKRDEIETGRASIEALRDYWIARVELERAVGGRLGDAGQLGPTEPSRTDSSPIHEPQRDQHNHQHGG